MKMTENKILAIAISAIILNLIAIRLDYNNHPEFVYYKQKDQVNAAVKTIVETGGTDGIEIPGIIKIDYKKTQQTIGFETFGFGLAPSSTNIGFYYSLNGSPVPYLGINHKLHVVDDHWLWHGEGDNHGSTYHIEGEWYTFRASF